MLCLPLCVRLRCSQRQLQGLLRFQAYSLHAYAARAVLTPARAVLTPARAVLTPARAVLTPLGPTWAAQSLYEGARMSA